MSIVLWLLVVLVGLVVVSAGITVFFMVREIIMMRRQGKTVAGAEPPEQKEFAA